MTKPINIVGHRLRRAREAAGLNIDQLAAELSYPTCEIRKLESGETEKNILLIYAISIHLGLEIEWVFGRPSQKPAQASSRGPQ